MPPRPSDGSGPPAAAEAVLAVPEIRDYELINKELARLLSERARRIVLAGVDGQRLLASRLRGPWDATIIVDGHAGPELAAGLDSPNLNVLCRGSASDGAGAGLSAGRLVLKGDAGDGLGYAQRGGVILVRGDAGHRAGLLQSGGILVILGSLGRLANERQSGGLFVARQGCLGQAVSHGARGGRRIFLDTGWQLPSDDLEALDAIRQSWPEPDPTQHGAR